MRFTAHYELFQFSFRRKTACGKEIPRPSSSFLASSTCQELKTCSVERNSTQDTHTQKERKRERKLDATFTHAAAHTVCQCTKGVVRRNPNLTWLDHRQDDRKIGIAAYVTNEAGYLRVIS